MVVKVVRKNYLSFWVEIAYQIFVSHHTACKYNDKTRMHSSMMRTVRCSSCLPGGCLPGGVCPGVSTQGVSAWGCLPQGVYTSPPWTEFLTSWHTPVKTLPFRNFVCGRNDKIICVRHFRFINNSSSSWSVYCKPF